MSGRSTLGVCHEIEAAAGGLLAFCTCCRLGPDAARSRRQKVVVVTENAYPPLQFIDADGKQIGWNMTR
jgi:ABC-type amino acid transport substrate-binding protein